MKRIIAILFIGGLALTGAPTRAQEVGAAFLKIGAGARAAALGNAYTAFSGDDVNALYWNPAGLGSLKRKELGFTHAQWLLGTQYNFLAFSLPVNGSVYGMDDYRGSFGVGLMGISIDEIDSRSADRTAQPEIKSADRAFLIGTGINHRPSGLNAGLSVKFIESEIADHSAQTFAVDLGMLYRLDLSRMPLKIGVSARNLGPGLKFIEQRDPLPTTLTLGLGSAINHTLNLALDMNYHVNESHMSFGLGTEVTPLRFIALRAGYLQSAASAGTSASGFSGLGGFGGGFGLKVKRYQFDYTFTPFGELGNTQRLSFGARF